MKDLIKLLPIPSLPSSPSTSFHCPLLSTTYASSPLPFSSPSCLHNSLLSLLVHCSYSSFFFDLLLQSPPLIFLFLHIFVTILLFSSFSPSIFYLFHPTPFFLLLLPSPLSSPKLCSSLSLAIILKGQNNNSLNGIQNLMQMHLPSTFLAARSRCTTLICSK